jgi:hypothetical protein
MRPARSPERAVRCQPKAILETASHSPASKPLACICTCTGVARITALHASGRRSSEAFPSWRMGAASPHSRCRRAALPPPPRRRESTLPRWERGSAIQGLWRRRVSPRNRPGCQDRRTRRGGRSASERRAGCCWHVACGERHVSDELHVTRAPACAPAGSSAKEMAAR